MTITWTPEITPINKATFEASVTATAVDSEDPDNPVTVEVPKTLIETDAHGDAIAAELEIKRLEVKIRRASDSDFITSREAALKAKLEVLSNG